MKLSELAVIVNIAEYYRLLSCFSYYIFIIIYFYTKIFFPRSIIT